MNCEEITKRLPEYLDGELDERERKLVEEHLEDCPGCAEELAVLKDYLENLGALEKVEPPPDFLNQVHARLEGQSVFKSAIKKIIFPIRFKIPLEAAGLAAAAVLIVYLLNISPANQLVPSVKDKSAIRTGQESDKLLTKFSGAASIPYPEKSLELGGGGTMEPAAPPVEDLLELDQAAPLSNLKNEIRGEGETVELVLLIEPETRYAREESRKSAPILGMKAQSLREAESPPLEEKKGQIIHSPPLTRLKDLITREGGEIISTEEENDLTRRISIKLTADRYRSFMEKLSRISDLQPDQSDQPIEAPITLRLRLTVK